MTAALIAVAMTEHEIRDLLITLLHDAGYRTRSYPRPAKAATLAAIPHDLILLDLCLVPPIRGWRLLSAMRAHAALQRIPILALTIDMAQVPSRQAQLDAWGVVLLAMPFELDELLATIRRLLPPPVEP